METITVPKTIFTKILEDAEILISDVEKAFEAKVLQRIADIDSGKEKGKTEEEYYKYLAKRGIKIGIRN